MTTSLSPSRTAFRAVGALPSESDVDMFWQAGMRFATGVSVITLGSGKRVHGSTVSAFTVVSRRPVLISLCLHASSELAERIFEHHTFAVSMLSRRQEGLARHFASPTRGRGPIEFAGVAWRPGFDAGVPLLDGALCWLWCTLRRVVPAGDHQILLAGVTAAEFGKGKPLLYFGGKLHPGVIEEACCD